jgi:uncharacterized protein (DUF779 family)
LILAKNDCRKEWGRNLFQFAVQEAACLSIRASQYAYWKHTQLIIDVVDGHGGTFSLEGNTGKAFHTRSRLFTDAEWAELQSG